jgi:hypothetical protein
VLTILFCGATLLNLAVTAAGHRWLNTGDRDRLALGLWIAAYWLAEEVFGRVLGWPFVWQVSPAFDFAAGALMLVAWLRRPNWWRMAVWLVYWAMCVAHLAYRLDFNPTDFASERYRILMNALYGLLLVITSGSVVWDAVSTGLRDRFPLLRGFRSRLRAGHEGSQ